MAHADAYNRLEDRSACEDRPVRARRVYPAVFDRVLSRTDPEQAHHLASRAIRAAGPTLAPAGRRVRARLPVVHAMGLRFRGVLGLAAGFDKDATGIDGFAALGFSFVEVGTVTGEPQPGNPRPRMFRLAQDRALVNRLGFNNEGAEAVARRQAERSRRREASGVRTGADPRGVVLGVNIGRTKVVPESGAVADYEKSARLLAPHADYLVVNVSSPNTPGLRDLQAVDRLQPLLTAVRRAADDAAARRVPLLVKIAPDLADEDVLAVADLALAIGLEGIVATNTTIGRTGLTSARVEVEASGVGGLSGSPLTGRATDVVRLLRARVGPDLTLIGAGGIMTPDDACARLDAGATLLQTYTGFVYGGPVWPARVQRAAAGRVARAPESEAVL